MKYFIDKVNTWSPANRKCKEVQAFVTEFRQTLIPDDAAVEALMEEIRQKVEELNEAYPRTKRLKVRKEGNFVACDNEDKKKPLSDQAIADALNSMGLGVARRTVAKYRETELKILPARFRKSV